MTRKDETPGLSTDFDDDIDLLASLLEAEGLDADATATIVARSAGDTVPMSFSQELLWMLDRATPGLTAYNLSLSFRLRGPVDVKALERALSLLAERHESLRTSFAEINGQALLRVSAPAPVSLTLVDATGRSEDESRAIVREYARRPFDLAHDHLFRPSLIQLSASEHVLLIDSHHIVMDGWSMGVLFRELRAAYAAFRSGNEPVLPRLTVQFGDFAIHQRKTLTGAPLDRLLAFWRQQLGDATEPLNLPTDFARPITPTFNGARESVVLPASTLTAIKNLAQQNNATLYMVLLAAYATVLHRYSGRDNVLVGSGSAGRGQHELESMVGYLNNTLVQRADFSGDPTFAELLSRVRASAIDASDHQDIPQEKLVLELRDGDARLSHAPLYEVVLTMQDTNGGSLQLDGLEIEPFSTGATSTKFDITLLPQEVDGTLKLTVQYRSDLFAPDSMQRFLGHLCAVLNSVVAHADVKVSRIALLSNDEQKSLRAWNETSVQLGARTTLTQAFERQVARVPDRVAVASETESLTYAAFNQRANQLAHDLRTRGVGNNTPVGLRLDRSASAIVGLMGILKAGGAYVPLSVEAPDARIAQQVREAGITIIVSSIANAPAAIDDVSTIKLDDGADAARLSSLPTENPTAIATPDSVAYVLYTSGSTGTPKGVAVTHANAVHYARAVSRVLADVSANAAGDGFEQLSGKHFAIASTLSADLGNTSLLPSLMSGGTLHVLSKDATTDAAQYGEYVRANKIDILKITPNHLAALTAGKTGHELAALLPAMWVVVGGEALRPDVARALLNANSCRLLNHYGPTETTVGVCTFEVTTSSLEQALKFGAQTVPLGKPLANTHAYVVDASNNEMPVGIPGELLLGGDGVTQGYFHRDDLTAERFITYNTERVYRTGDRVRRLPSGAIEFLGRADDQVKIRGHRVELGEVEHALRAHPGVANAVVVMRDDAAGQSTLVGFAAARTGDYAVSHSDRPTAERLSEWLAVRLPAHMIPSTIVLLDAIPLTANGKVDRAKLPATIAAAEAQYVAPRNDIETQLVAIWTDVLKHENIGITDNFLALGGHSLMAIRVLGKISKAFGVRLPLRILFETPTIEELAVVIEKERGASKPVSSGIGASSRDKYKIGPSAPAAGTGSGDAS
ncbi:MAG: amino acid adenylation domain-containing protein [Gemmatimonadaceae bacterium]